MKHNPGDHGVIYASRLLLILLMGLSLLSLPNYAKTAIATADFPCCSPCLADLLTDRRPVEPQGGS